jgi:hypothetical protein
MNDGLFEELMHGATTALKSDHSIGWCSIRLDLRLGSAGMHLF